MSDASSPDEYPIAPRVFRQLLDGAGDGLFIIDPETGALEDANRTVAEWLGYDPETLREMTIFDCQTTFAEPGEWQAFVDRVRDEDGVRIENEIRTKDGSTVPVEGTISVVAVDGDDHVVAIPRKLDPEA
ncbi:PAS domain S-box protein [Haloparvum sp. AD34]